ncbi:MAG: OmpA family protein [Polyangiaceae bacterium]|nr:OmpA family protein [Polyangiaceae bacterium]
MSFPRFPFFRNAALGRSTLRYACCLAALSTGLFVAGDARGQAAEVAAGNGNGMDTHLFRPAMDSKGFFSQNGSDILGHNDISFGFVIDYANQLMRIKNDEALIPHSFQGTLQFNYGLGNLAVVGIDLPVVLLVGDPVNSNGWVGGKLDTQSLGNVGLHAKFRILRVEKGFGLAAAVSGGIPLTDARKSGGADPGAWVWPQLIGEKRFGATGRFRVAANVGFRAHSTSSTVLNLDFDGTPRVFQDGQRVTYGLAASARVLDPLDIVLEGYGTYLVGGASDSKIRPSNEAVGGIKLFVDRNSYLMLGGGAGFLDGFESARYRAFLGIIYEPSIGDRDGDGIKDDVDKCPDQPEDFDGFEDEDGCPDPDNDKDGILDVDDRCPNEPEDKDGDEDEDGCPEGNDGDRDGDGILDSKDKCPDIPEDRDGFEDEDGCPDPDNDKDGILDKVDQCPNDPEDKDGFQDEDGCPDLDNDRDGIPDTIDKCPNEPETFNGIDDEDGCPEGNVIIQNNSLVILQKIKFKTGSAEILPESNPILDEVSKVLTEHSEFTLLELAGHADERADDFYNLRLTQDRVNSVRQALIMRGVHPTRLRSKGYGEWCPEDPEHNETAWEKNRRVEFKIVKTLDGPTGVQLGCEAATKKGARPDPVP